MEIRLSKDHKEIKLYIRDRNVIYRAGSVAELEQTTDIYTAKSTIEITAVDLTTGIETEYLTDHVTYIEDVIILNKKDIMHMITTYPSLTPPYWLRYT